YQSYDSFEKTSLLLSLDLRGTPITLERHLLLHLPECLLSAMFPRGSALNKKTDTLQSLLTRQENQVIFVDVDPACLAYVLRFYQGKQAKPSLSRVASYDAIWPLHSPFHSPLLTQQPLMVLREELDYYCNRTSKESHDMTHLKLICGQYLKQQDLIVETLEKRMTRENNAVERHLLDILSEAGFKQEDRWGHRAMEPMRTCIISMGCILIPTTGAPSHKTAAQKLLFFWKNSARKCWWEGITVTLEHISVRLWARRTWTLEVVLV
ncbi:hypothetical protein BDF14DRAFT_1708602, partial [Spinellus fusiger]